MTASLWLVDLATSTAPTMSPAPLSSLRPSRRPTLRPSRRPTVLPAPALKYMTAAPPTLRSATFLAVACADVGAGPSGELDAGVSSDVAPDSMWMPASFRWRR